MNMDLSCLKRLASCHRPFLVQSSTRSSGSVCFEPLIANWAAEALTSAASIAAFEVFTLSETLIFHSCPQKDNSIDATRSELS